MKRKLLAVMGGLLLVFATSGAQAVTFQLTDHAVNKIVNGVGPNLSFPAFSGLGTLHLYYAGAGNYNVLSFFDYDLGTDSSGYLSSGFLNEYGYSTGTPDLNESWEINDPYVTAMVDNFKAGALANATGIPDASAAAALAADAAMALGYTFTLTPTECAYVDFTVTDQAPGSGFYLTQVDGYTNEKLYLEGGVKIEPLGPSEVPEPSTLALFGLACAGMGLYLKRRRNG